MQNQEEYPIPERIYTAKVINIVRHGIVVELYNFTKNHKTMINKTEIPYHRTFQLKDTVHIKVISFSSDGLLVATMKGLTQPVQASVQAPKQIVHRRTASPNRWIENKFVGGNSDVRIELITEEPYFLKIHENKMLCRIPAKIHVVKNPSSHMAKVADREMNRTSHGLFYLQESSFDSDWKKVMTINEGMKNLKISPSKEDFNLGQKMSIKKQREALPIFKHREQIIKAVADNRVIIVIGETGSGKTTQIPQYLFESGFIIRGKIGCTQPRRVAAKEAARRVALENGCVVGKEVGYRIRYENVTTSETLIKYMTDGILLRECMIDPQLSAYSVIMLDEAHERSIYTDVLFGLLKGILKENDKLRLIITSATLDSDKFSTFFNNAPILNIPGKKYQVEIYHRIYNESEYFNAALNTVMNLHIREPLGGDILLFLPGKEEVDRALDILDQYEKKAFTKFGNMLAVPMYSALSHEQLDEVLQPTPSDKRKIIVATNIAETSLTIAGVKYVVDPGYFKQKVHNPRSGVDSLTFLPISQASAEQRAGRAGRTMPGKCYRIYTVESFNNEMLTATVPEIQRANLASSVLQLLAIGIDDIINFEFMDTPPKDALLMALKELYLLEAIDQYGIITELGFNMAGIPLDPKYSKMLISSVELKCSDEIITIIAMLLDVNVFYRPRNRAIEADYIKGTFHKSTGDHLTLLEVYKNWEKNNYSSDWCKHNFVNEKCLVEAQNMKEYLFRMLEEQEIEIFSAGRNIERIQKAICAGMFQNVVKINKGSKEYKTLIDSQSVYIHPSSSLFKTLPDWMVYNVLHETKKKYLRNVTVINPEWLLLYGSKLYKRI